MSITELTAMAAVAMAAVALAVVGSIGLTPAGIHHLGHTRITDPACPTHGNTTGGTK